MSISALSPEAHESLAEAMTASAASNSSVVKTSPARYGTNKVVAHQAGRFRPLSASSPAYLSMPTSSRLVAQGRFRVKVGQLPVIRVSPCIAKLRYSVPGAR